ncbi:MAG: hypothetical protein HFG42_08255 [Lachnospiraceae bacterium]|nr:hypothetical protein [Lachnospiraceae bacterium]
MKHILKKILAIGVICCLTYAMPVFAENRITDSENEIYVDKLERPNINKAKSVSSARGVYISVSNAGITNVGNGVIGISALTTAHESVDKIRIHLYLDRLNENKKWIQVDDFDYYFYPEDEPDGKLTIAAIDLEVDDQPSGYYYRVRGTHGVWKNGVSESQSTRTDGVLITNP